MVFPNPGYKGYINSEAKCNNCPFFNALEDGKNGECWRWPPVLSLTGNGTTYTITKDNRPEYKYVIGRPPTVGLHYCCGEHPDLFKEPPSKKLEDTKPNLDIE